MEDIFMLEQVMHRGPDQPSEPFTLVNGFFSSPNVYAPPPLEMIEGRKIVRKTLELTHEQVLSSLLTELRPIDYRELAGLSDGESLTKKQQVVITIEECVAQAKKRRWGLCTSHQNVYLYNGAFWKQIEEPQLEDFLGKAAEAFGLPKFEARYHSNRKDLVKQFFSTSYLPKPKNTSSETLVNLENGTFCISQARQYLREFRREDFLTYQLPFSYDENAIAPVFDNYLVKVLPNESDRKILAEYMGYIFISSKTLKLEKSLMAVGSGANGKSVFFEVTKALLGYENISHFSLQALTNDTGYQRAKLENKLLNYASEISTHMQSTIFKQLVSGEPVEARLPYKEPFILEDYAKLMFNTNRLPIDVEHNDAFFRRFIILPFSVTIPESERDPELASKIIASELPGVFNWVLDGLKRLLQNKKFTHSSTVEEMLNQYRQQSDPVHLFIVDEGYETSNSAKTSLKTLYERYKDYTTECGFKNCSIKEFANRLRNLGYETHREAPGMMVNCTRKSFITHTSDAPATSNMH